MILDRLKPTSANHITLIWSRDTHAANLLDHGSCLQLLLNFILNRILYWIFYLNSFIHFFSFKFNLLCLSVNAWVKIKIIFLKMWWIE